MRRVVLLVSSLLLALPVGVGLSGCGGGSSTGAPGTLCPGYTQGGPVVGQPTTIVLQPYTTGISLNYAQSASLSTPAATDCTGANVSIASYQYSVDPVSAAAHLLDINTTNGAMCAGQWNRNSPGGTPDYSTCNSTGVSGIATVTATGGGASSNRVQVFVHPIITSIQIGSTSTDCTNDPASNCAQYAAVLPAVASQTQYNPNTCLSFGDTAQLVTRYFNAVTTGPVGRVVTTAAFSGTAGTPASVSFGLNSTYATDTFGGTLAVVYGGNTIGVAVPNNTTGSQLLPILNATGGAFQTNGITASIVGTTLTLTGPTPTNASSVGANTLVPSTSANTFVETVNNNVTYLAGLPTFALQNSAIGVFDQNNRGIFTASAPGSSLVTASLGTGAGSTTSNAGFIAVCPPQSITINTTNARNGAVTVPVSNTEPITATVVDTKGKQITGLALTYLSTSPISTPVSSSGIIPVFAGGSNISAYCLPPSCNPAPLNQIGRYPNGTQSGNGKPVSSNPIVVTTPGVTSSLIWAASTDSLYLLPLDLTAGAVPAPTKLPYQPNSLVLTQDGGTIYMGSTTGLMTYNTATNSVTSVNTALQGLALAVSPSGSDVVVSDPVRKLIYVYSPSTSGIVSSFGGVGTRAAWTQDGTTVYVATSDNRLLVYNTTTSWHSYDLSSLGQVNDVVTAVPVVGAFVGTQTNVDGRSYCPNTTATTTDFYPEALNNALAAAVVDRLAATNDGKHLLDVRLATANGTPVMNDLLLGNGAGLPTGACPASGAQPTFTTTLNTATLTGLQAATVTGVYPASDSSIAFVTNIAATGATGTGATLAAYRPAAAGAGTVRTVTLANGATAAVAGALSSDNRFFFAGTSGDNKLHFITVSTLTDDRQISPNLPLASNPAQAATPNLVVSRPRTSLNGQ